jgi:hypothetical protein
MMEGRGITENEGGMKDYSTKRRRKYRLGGDCKDEMGLTS